jgi:coatomer protein complex subunit alpha (xenin)
MFIKFERNSDRVKSVSFHPHRPYLLSALHSGTIELIDYRIKKRIAIYEDH